MSRRLFPVHVARIHARYEFPERFELRAVAVKPLLFLTEVARQLVELERHPAYRGDIRGDCGGEIDRVVGPAFTQSQGSAMPQPDRPGGCRTTAQRRETERHGCRAVGLDIELEALGLEDRSVEFQNALWVTVRFALITVPLGLVLGVGLAVLADKTNWKYVWATEHHALTEYSHLSSSEVFLGYLGSGPTTPPGTGPRGSGGTAVVSGSLFPHVSAVDYYKSCILLI